MPDMEVLIQPLRKVIDVEPGANLLDALRNAQVPVSYSCRAGRCGTCRCRVLAGDVLDSGGAQQNPLDGHDFSVLACQTYLTEPCTIEIPEPGRSRRASGAHHQGHACRRSRPWPTTSGASS